MSNENSRTELRELVAGFRQFAESERYRGVLEEPAEHKKPKTEPSPVVSSDRNHGRNWAAVASESREEMPTTLGQARQRLGDCQQCGLCQSRRHLVYGVGRSDADLMIIGEAPGYHEDQRGEPFVGPAGEMLDKMLVHVLGLTRNDVYITNVVKCRPPKNRNPLPDEVDACRSVLETQCTIIQPKLILILGTVALKTVLGTEQGIMRNRGNWKEWRGIPVMPTFHPAYLLRNGAEKRKTFEDLKALRARYESVSGFRPDPG